MELVERLLLTLVLDQFCFLSMDNYIYKLIGEYGNYWLSYAKAKGMWRFGMHAEYWRSKREDYLFTSHSAAA